MPLFKYDVKWRLPTHGTLQAKRSNEQAGRDLKLGYFDSTYLRDSAPESIVEGGGNESLSELHAGMVIF